MTKDKRLAENRRKAAIADKKFERAAELEKNYHNSAEAKRLRKAVEDAIDEANVLISEWNDIILDREGK